jgi:hypothetical protein
VWASPCPECPFPASSTPRSPVSPRFPAPFRTDPARDQFMNNIDRSAVRPLHPIRATVLLAGPALTWSLTTVLLGSARPGELELAAAVVVLLWSPLFFSVPALMMQRERDRALPAGGGPIASLRRGLLLPQALLRGPAAPEFAVSIAGWALLIAISGPAALRGLGMLVG